MNQLYDVFDMDAKTFLGRIPMRSLVNFYKLRKEAVARIEHQTNLKATGNACSVYFNRGGNTDIIVKRVSDWPIPVYEEGTYESS